MKGLAGPAPDTFKLSIIIPAYNEAATLPDLLQRVLAVPFDKELIVVDDGSTDETPSLLGGFKASPGVILLHHGTNRGKGAAILTARDHISGDAVVIQDADLEYDPADYDALVEPIRRGEEKVIYGARRGPYHSYLRYYLGGRMLSLVANILYRQRLTDLSTGYKIFEAGFFRSLPLRCRGFEFCAEVTARIAKRGIRIREIPIRYRPRTFAEGKKIRWTVGVHALWTLIKYRFMD